jgi:hypothetical protein
MTDYFKFQRKRIYLGLDAEAVEALGKTPDNCEDPAWHPHVIMEARPSFGAQQFVRGMRKALAPARKAALAEIDAAEVKARVAEMPEEEYREACKANEIKSRPALVDALLDIMVMQSAVVQLAAYRVLAARVAVCLRAVGGDFTCYANPMPTPEWPGLDTDDALERRIAIVRTFADADVTKLNRLALASLEVDEDEAGK